MKLTIIMINLICNFEIRSTVYYKLRIAKSLSPALTKKRIPRCLHSHRLISNLKSERKQVAAHKYKRRKKRVKYQKASDDNTIKSLVSQTLTECKTLAHYINVRVAVTQSKAPVREDSKVAIPFKNF